MVSVLDKSFAAELHDGRIFPDLAGASVVGTIENAGVYSRSALINEDLGGDQPLQWDSN